MVFSLISGKWSREKSSDLAWDPMPILSTLPRDPLVPNGSVCHILIRKELKQHNYSEGFYSVLNLRKSTRSPRTPFWDKVSIWRSVMRTALFSTERATFSADLVSTLLWLGHGQYKKYFYVESRGGILKTKNCACPHHYRTNGSQVIPVNISTSSNTVRKCVRLLNSVLRLSPPSPIPLPSGFIVLRKFMRRNPSKTHKFFLFRRSRMYCAVPRHLA